MKYLLLLWLVYASSLNNTYSQFVTPAEWDSHECIWVSFRTASTGCKYDSITIPIIKLLTQKVTTNILVENQHLLAEGKLFFSKFDIDTSNINLVYFSPLDFWLRDTGPVFIKNKSNKIQVCDFRYTAYKNVPFKSVSNRVRLMEEIDRKLAHLYGWKVRKSKIVMEGGAYETNGAGTIILVDSLILKRNQGLSKQQIEKELQKKMGVQSFIWLNEGLTQDPNGSKYLGEFFYATGTGGHTDHFVRFANDSTILLYWESDSIKNQNPISRINRERMAKNLEIINKFVDHRGKKMTVIKIPSPGLIYKTQVINKALQSGLSELPIDTPIDSIKIVACTGYLNYLISNNLVILPKYGVMDDNQAKKIFTKIYPNHEIFQINPLQLNYAAGGIRCIYRQQPYLIFGE